MTHLFPVQDGLKIKIGNRIRRGQCERAFCVLLVDRLNQARLGFTRIKPLGRRKGDGAELVEISLVS